ncbi:MAG: cytochrome c oxidase subunit II, partial [Gemmatimonadales bacterium]
TTANEIHVPVGRPVRVRLRTGDVIHSFWVPELAGKLDLIPGQENTMWFQADSAGIYHGQCAEYCGMQHAHMGIEVVAVSMEDFELWRAGQLAPAVEPDDRAAWLGKQVFQSAGCAGCHTVRGTDAQGVLGPDLTHVASRRTLAAGAIPNTRGWLAGWIVSAQSLKPGAHMPDVPLDSEELQAVLAYVENLR